MTSRMNLKRTLITYGLLPALFFGVSCSDKKNNNTTSTFDQNPYTTYYTPSPGSVYPPGTNYNWINPGDQFQATVQSLVGRIAQSCSTGMVYAVFSSPANISGSRLLGPFYNGGNVSGQTLQLYAGMGFGGSPQSAVYREAMFIRKVGQGNNITGFVVELFLCQDGVLVTPQRQIGELNVNNGGYIYLGQNQSCAIGNVDAAVVYLAAGPGPSQPYVTRFPASFFPVGGNLCP